MTVEPGSTQDKLELFKGVADGVIREALPILETHRGWKQFLLDIVNILCLLGSGLVSYAATQRFRLFALPTDSSEKVRELQQNIQQISINAF